MFTCSLHSQENVTYGQPKNAKKNNKLAKTKIKSHTHKQLCTVRGKFKN